MKLYNNKSQFVDAGREVRELALECEGRERNPEALGILYVDMRNSRSHV